MGKAFVRLHSKTEVQKGAPSVDIDKEEFFARAKKLLDVPQFGEVKDAVTEVQQETVRQK